MIQSEKTLDISAKRVMIWNLSDKSLLNVNVAQEALSFIKIYRRHGDIFKSGRCKPNVRRHGMRNL